MMQDDPDLDGLFALAATKAPQPSAELLARIAQDAAREQPRPRALAKPAPGWGFWLADLFGGRGGLAGLTLAAVSGLWIGVAQPASLLSFGDYLGVSATMELLPSDAVLLAGE